jgi:hypothetical protein
MRGRLRFFNKIISPPRHKDTKDDENLKILGFSTFISWCLGVLVVIIQFWLPVLSFFQKISWKTLVCAAWGLFCFGPGLLWSQEANLSPDAIANQKDPTELIQEADGIFAEVSRLSGLPIKTPVQKKFEDQAFFRDYYLQLLQEQYPPEKKRAFEKAFTFFGFLAPGADLIQTYLDSFMKVVEGLYDPKTKTLYIADWIKSGDQEGTMAHELTHALQDQYFGLEPYLEEGEKLSMDQQFARAAVMEGQAVAIALNYSLEDHGRDFTKVANIADWVQLNNLLTESGQRAFGIKTSLNQVISFPYVYGATFLQSYIKAYGWGGMDYLFKHPPTSTHQILHPGDFFPRRRNPVGVSIDDMSSNVLMGFNKVWENTFGEYGLATLLQEYMPEKEALYSVRGWRGDSVQIYENNMTHGLIMVGYVVFDGEETADDFFQSYKSLLGKKYEVDIFRRSDDTIYWASLKGLDAEAYVERFGRRVVMVEGGSYQSTPRIRGALWVMSSGSV